MDRLGLLHGLLRPVAVGSVSRRVGGCVRDRDLAAVHAEPRHARDPAEARRALRGVGRTRTELVKLEQMSDEELAQIEQEFARLRDEEND
jgi:uncharacterized protein YjiS (DUF1127 family)